MKTLKYLGMGLLVLVAAFLVYAFSLPGHVHVERSRDMAASTSIVFEQVNTLKNWENWSYWHSIDPKMRLEYGGPEKGVGAWYAWDSEKKDSVGTGKLTIVHSVQDDTIGTAMEFEGMGNSTSGYRFRPTEKGTEVLLTMDADLGLDPIARAMGSIIKESVERDFEKTLERLEKEAIRVERERYRPSNLLKEAGAALDSIGL